MAELLTMKIVEEYRLRADTLPYNGLQDIGERRKLREEIQERCGLTELEAVNILNGHHVKDYIAICRRRQEENETAEKL